MDHIRDDTIVVNVSSFKNVDEALLAQMKPNVRLVPSVGKASLELKHSVIFQAGCHH